MSKDEQEIVAEPKYREEDSEEMSILLQKVLDRDDSPEFTKEQVDELLSQKREITKLVHQDKKQESYDNKFFLVVIVLFILIFSALVLKLYPSVFPQVLSLVIGLFGGGAGGYALAKGKSQG